MDTCVYNYCWFFVKCWWEKKFPYENNRKNFMLTNRSNTHTHTRKGCCFCSLRFPGKCYYWCSKRFSRYNTDALNETHRYLINTVYSIIFFVVQENWLFWFLNENAVDTSTETITRIIGIQPLAPILCAKTRNKMRKNEILSVSLRQICVCVQWLILFKKKEKKFRSC